MSQTPVQNSLVALAQKGDPEELAWGCANCHGAERLRFVHPEDGIRVTLLMAAAQNGHLDAVRFLVVQGADIDAGLSDAGSDTGRTALMFAAGKGHYEIVEYLLDNAPRVNNFQRRAGFGWRAILSAAVARYPQITRFLPRLGPDVNAVDCNGITALMLAGRKGYLEILHVSLNNGTNVTAPNVMHEIVRGGEAQRAFAYCWTMVQKYLIPLHSVKRPL